MTMRKIRITTEGLKIAFPTDEHRPFHDPKAINLAQRIVNDFDPHWRITGSDALDFYTISSFSKDPSRIKECNLQAEIDSWTEGQKEWLDAAPNASQIFIMGNHEDRFRRYIWSKAPELAGLHNLQLSSLLQFDLLKIPEQIETEILFGRKLVVRHGKTVRKHSAYTAKGELENEFFDRSVLTGHTHRGGTVYATKRGTVVQATECFCLCDQNPEYVQNPNWQQGIVLAEVYRGGYHIEPVLFTERRGKLSARWRGKEYIGD